MKAYDEFTLDDLKKELKKLSSKYDVKYIKFLGIVEVYYKGTGVLELSYRKDGYKGEISRTEHFRDSLPFSHKMQMLVAEWNLEQILVPTPKISIRCVNEEKLKKLIPYSFELLESEGVVSAPISLSDEISNGGF